MDRELPELQAGFRRGRGTGDQIANMRWIMENAREFQKNIYFCFIDYSKAFDCVDHSKLWQVLKQMGAPDHLIFLMKNLYVGQKATVRNGYMEKLIGSKLGKEYDKDAYCLHAYLPNLYAEYLITLSTSWEIYMWDTMQQLELDMQQLIGSKLGKEYNKAVYCLPAYLTYMQNTLCESCLLYTSPSPRD